MKPLPPSYDHKAREKFWQERWAESDVYNFRDDKPRGETFVIDTPPPTVSGVLHMGHIFSYTQADFVARFQRMSGKDVFYPMGFDDNGLPTERLVEKIKEKKASQYPSREAFVADCREVVKSAEEDFRKLFKSVALSVDWKQEYQTISDDVRKLSQASFVDLLKKGEAYRDFRPTYWDWVDQTAIAQAEIENKEMPGVMNEILFTLSPRERDGVRASPMAMPSSGASRHLLPEEEGIVIATTRPELLGACVAVMYHPEDPNAAKYKGKYAVTPLFGVKVPMIADELVERDKGTGLVMCCTFGDDTDKEWVRKHEKEYELRTRPILSKEGRISVITFANTDTIMFRGSNGDKFTSGLHERNTVDIKKTRQVFESLKDENGRGLKPKQANAKIIELLEEAGLLKDQKQITHTVKCAERSGTPIEIIPTYQWFIKIINKKEQLLDKGAECAWHPEFMRIRLNQWIEGLKEDWCISRQRFFGVPFPVWYSKRSGEEGKILFADLDQLPVDPMADLPKGYAREEVDADKDVMDTWATSSISPQINAKSLRPNKLFPADLRPQAHEIIRTWAFYTIVKAHLHCDTIPWKNLMISGWCLAADKTKMSKSKGNVVTPVALIEDKGSDAVRYWASTSRLGADTAFSEDLLKIGRKLVTKLWNAGNFVAGFGIQDFGFRELPLESLCTLDKWILSRLHQCIKKATQEFERFEYCDARVAIEDFFWNDFCDNYLELVKARAYGESSESGVQSSEKNTTEPRTPNSELLRKQQSALHTLHHCLDAILRLFAPFTPHIAEELYSHVFEGRGSVHRRGNWPKAEDYLYDAEAEKSGMAAVDILNVVRKAKSEANVSIKTPVKLVAVQETANTPWPWKYLVPVLADLKAAASAADIAQMQGHETICRDPDYLSGSGHFHVWVRFEKIEEHKRNPAQKETEQLEKEILHGPGDPDLSKHVVRLQVESLPQTLDKQKQR